MQITALFTQRANLYAGEHAPELLDAVDEITQSDNPDYLNEKIAQTDSNTGLGKEFASWALITFDLADDVIEAALNPVTATEAVNVFVGRTSNDN